MAKAPLISVVMPVYNAEKFIFDAVTQILNQTLKDFELILVNDGSSDESLEIMTELSKQDKRIRVFSKTNGGTGSALNLGFAKATGKYGTWIAHDDMKYVSFLETLYNLLQEYKKCKMAFSAFHEFIDGKYEERRPRIFVNRWIKTPHIVKNFLDISSQYCVTGICFLFDMELKKRCGDYECIPGEDYIMGVKMGILEDVVYTPQYLGAHRLHPKSLTVSKPGCAVEADNIAKNMIKQIRGF